jgi:hypothetical protein
VCAENFLWDHFARMGEMVANNVAVAGDSLKYLKSLLFFT